MRIKIPITTFIAATLIILPLVFGAVDLYEDHKLFIVLITIGGALIVVGWVTVFAKIILSQTQQRSD